MEKYNIQDKEKWNQIFSAPDPAWKNVPEQAFMKDVLKFFSTNLVETVLDVGCGVGVWASYLARHGFSVCGADFSEKAIETAKAWATESGLYIRFEVAPITADVFPDMSFDSAIATMIFDNVESAEMHQAIRLLSRKLKRGGVLFTLFNPYLSKEQKEQVIQNTNNPTKGITSVTYTDGELKAAFPDFKLVEFKKYDLQGLDFRGIFLKKIEF